MELCQGAEMEIREEGKAGEMTGGGGGGSILRGIARF